MDGGILEKFSTNFITLADGCTSLGCQKRNLELELDTSKLDIVLVHEKDWTGDTGALMTNYFEGRSLTSALGKIKRPFLSFPCIKTTLEI